MSGPTADAHRKPFIVLTASNRHQCHIPGVRIHTVQCVATRNAIRNRTKPTKPPSSSSESGREQMRVNRLGPALFVCHFYPTHRHRWRRRRRWAFFPCECLVFGVHDVAHDYEARRDVHSVVRITEAMTSAPATATATATTVSEVIRQQLALKWPHAKQRTNDSV